MAKISDLVEYFKLEAEFDAKNNCTIQTSEVSVKSPGRRKIRLKKRWNRVRQVGHGGSGAVWLEALEDDPGEERAVKEILKDKDNTLLSSGLDYYRELLALGNLSKHESLFVSFHGWYESSLSLYLVMEYVELGDLAKFVTAPLKETDVQSIAKQLLEGLIVLHAQGWAHRDLKPQNIFVMSGPPKWWIKIGDFGISKRNRDNETSWRTCIGTRDYMAPERTYDLHEDDFDIGDDDSVYTVAVDIWSLGCVLYWLLIKENPFPSRKQFVNYCRNRQGFPISALKSQSISAAGIAFINALLMPHPSARPTAQAALEDPWIQSFDQQTLLEASAIGSTKQKDYQEGIIFNWRSGRERTFIGSECAVCEEPLEHTLRGERILLLSCGHVSHEACFYEYIKEFESQYCPTCNAPLGFDTSRAGNVLDLEKLRSVVRSVALNNEARD